MCGHSGTHPVQILAISFYAFQHFFLSHAFIHMDNTSFVIVFILRPHGASCVYDQKRSERIRVLPYSSIALTRSCLAFFFIAIPPKKFCGRTAFESLFLKSCSRVVCLLRLRWTYYSTRSQRKKVG